MNFVKDHQDVCNVALPGGKDTKVLTPYQKLAESNQHIEEISNKLGECREFLGVPKVKEDVFLRILQDLDVNKKTSHSLQASNSNAGLMKSVSYPLSRSSGSHIRDKHFSTLRLKHTEIWVFPKGEQPNIDSHADKEFSSSDAQDNVQSVLAENDDSVVDSIGNRRAHKFSLGSSLGLNHQNWNQMVVHRFKRVKQKIKHVLLEFKKDRRQNFAEEMDQKISTECRLTKIQEAAQSINDGSNQDSEESTECFRSSGENWDSDLNEQNASSFRRSCALNDSLDRYTDLFERSFGKVKRWSNSKSKSLKLANEDNAQISRSDSKSCRRNLSLPDLDGSRNSSMPAKASLDNAHKPSVPARNSVDSNTYSVRLSFHTDEPGDMTVDTGLQNANKESSQNEISFNSSSDLAMVELEYNEGVAEASDDLRDDMHVEEAVTGSPQQTNKELECIINPSTELIEQAQEAMAFENDHQENCTIYKEDRGSIRSFVDSTHKRTNLEDIRPASKCQEEHSLSFEFDLKDGSDLKYTGNEHSGTLNITQDKFNQLLIREVQALLANEYELSSDNIGHQLLLDLVNEVLLDLQETLSTQFPRPLPSNCRVCPIPKGHSLLEEVWTGLNSYLRLRPELDQSLDDIVGQDMAKDSWMKLNSEIERVTVELEGMIFNELFDELICA